MILDNNDSIAPITIINNKFELNSQRRKNNKNPEENLKMSLLINKSKSNNNKRSLSGQYRISFDEKENEKNYNKESNGHINFNLFDYYCLRKLSSRKKEIELFNKGSSLYRRRMDIINVFTLLLLTEKKLLNHEKKRNRIKEVE